MLFPSGRRRGLILCKPVFDELTVELVVIVLIIVLRLFPLLCFAVRDRVQSLEFLLKGLLLFSQVIDLRLVLVSGMNNLLKSRIRDPVLARACCFLSFSRLCRTLSYFFCL